MPEYRDKHLAVFIALFAGLAAVLWPVVSVCGPGGRNQRLKASSSVEITLHAGQPEYSITGTGGDTVRINGFSWFHSPGDPQLPSRTYTVLLPPEADLSTISVSATKSSSSEVAKKLDVKACPPFAVQQRKPGPGGKGKPRTGKAKPGGLRPDRLEWGDGKKIEHGRNLLVYGHSMKFPSSPVQLENTGMLGQLKFARVRFMPVQYNPVTKKLVLNSSVTCSISFRTGKKGTVSSQALQTLRSRRAAKLFTNPSEAEQWYEPDSAKTSTTSGGEPVPNLPAGDTGYLIVTTDAINNSGALDDFITHKGGQGWIVTVLTETTPLGGYGSAIGQTRCDNIRTWLQSNYVDYNLQYVLLVGDPRIDGSGVPMKQAYPKGRNYNPSGYPEYVPTDFYYADLTGDWDGDNDGYCGEQGDDDAEVDFSAEVYVGRIPVYSDWATKLPGMLTKIINYQSAGISEREWRKSILLPESFSDASTDGAYLGQEMVSSFLDNEGFSYYRMYQQGNYDSGYDDQVDSSYDVPTDCEQELRAGSMSYSNSVVYHWANHTDGYGIVQWWGHGNQRGAYAGFTYHEDDRDTTYYNAFMHSNWVGSLDNSKPAFTMQISCTNADPANTSNLAYSLLTNGAIATLAGTNVTWYSPGQQSFDGTYLNAGIGYEYVERLVVDQPCGDAYFDAVANLSWSSSTAWWNFMCFAVYGDPSCNLNLPPVLEISTESLADCEVGGSYSVFLQAQYGTEPYTWSIASGSLPSGLSLNTGTGEISGSPDTAGWSRFTVEVTDSESVPVSAQKAFSVQIFGTHGELPVPGLSVDSVTTSSVTWTWTEPSGSFDSYLLQADDHSVSYAIDYGETTYTENGFGPNTLVVRHFHTLGTSAPGTLYSTDFSNSTGWTLGPGAEVEDQSSTGTSQFGYLVDSGQYTAQSFTSGMTGTLVKVEVEVNRRSQALNDLTVEIRPNVSSEGDDFPGSTPLGSVTIPISEIPEGGWQLVSAEFSISLDSGTLYWIVLSNSDTSGEGYLWRRGNNNSYSGGNAATSAGSSTGPWSLIPNYDCRFTTYMGGPGWQIDEAQAGVSGGSGNPDPDTDHTETGNDNVLGYIIGDDYSNNLPKRWAISPEVDCSGVTGVTLRFWRWLNVEEGAFDKAYIYVSPDGGSNWTQVWVNPLNSHVTDNAWIEVELPITSSAAGYSQVQVGFAMGPTDGGLVFSGWNIDDLEITGVVDYISEASSPSTEVYTLAAVPGVITLTQAGLVNTSWEANGNPAGTEYELQRREEGSSIYEDVYSGTDISYRDADVTVDTTYYYRVRAVNGDGVPTDWTDEYSVTPLAWGTTDEIPAAGSGTRPRKARLALDSEGTLHCIWQQTDSTEPEVRNIYYSYWNGSAWNTPVCVSTNNPGGDNGLVDHAHFEIDSGNVIHFVWSGPDTAGVMQVWYRKYNGSWSDIEQLSSGDDHSYWPDIAVSSTGGVIDVVYVTWVGQITQQIYHTRYSGGSWSSSVNISNSTESDEWGPSIDVDGSGVAHFAWCAWHEEFSSYDLVYRSYDGSDWSAVCNLSQNSGKSYGSDIVTGTGGTILVAWDDTTPGNYTPMYSYYNGTTWSTAAAIATSLPHRAEYVSLAYSNGTFYASWSQCTQLNVRQVWLSSFDGSSWTSPVRVSTGDGCNWLGATGGGMAIESDGTVHIAHDESGTGVLQHTSGE